MLFSSSIVGLVYNALNGNEKSAKDDIPKLAQGTVLRIELSRLGILGFDHYGIYAGNKNVIHFSGGKICQESLSQFINGAGILNLDFVEVMGFKPSAIDKISLDESYKRAKSCLGMKGYDVLDANCEHFAIWCRTGEPFSGQAFGSKSDLFNIPVGSGALNIPRMIGKTFTKLGMKTNRKIMIKNIVDVD